MNHIGKRPFCVKPYSCIPRHCRFESFPRPRLTPSALWASVHAIHAHRLFGLCIAVLVCPQSCCGQGCSPLEHLTPDAQNLSSPETSPQAMHVGWQREVRRRYRGSGMQPDTVFSPGRAAECSHSRRKAIEQAAACYLISQATA